MNLFDAINEALETPVTPERQMIVAPDGAVYSWGTCYHCDGRGHFYSKGLCYRCDGTQVARVYCGHPDPSTVTANLEQDNNEDAA